MAITLDSLDDSLIEKKQQEIKDLKRKNNDLERNNDELRTSLSRMTETEEELLFKIRTIEQKNRDLEKKLLQYEHDPVIMKNHSKGIDILFWDTEKNDYSFFASFYYNNLEKDLEEFCQEFIMELKDAYMVE